MELSPLFTTYPLIWFFVALVLGLFVTGNLLRRFAWIFSIGGALGLTGILIFVFLFDGNYLDAALIALLCLLPLFIFFALPHREKKQEEPTE